MGHPSVSEACAIAIPDDHWQERPLACVVIREGAEFSPANFMEFLNRDFAHYQVPEHYIQLTQIPKTSVGKFDKKELTRMYAEGNLFSDV